MIKKSTGKPIRINLNSVDTTAEFFFYPLFCGVICGNRMCGRLKQSSKAASASNVQLLRVDGKSRRV